MAILLKPRIREQVPNQKEMKMRFRTLSGVCVAALMIAASVQIAAADTIKIGVFGPMSGDAAAMAPPKKIRSISRLRKRTLPAAFAARRSSRCSPMIMASPRRPSM